MTIGEAARQQASRWRGAARSSGGSGQLQPADRRLHLGHAPVGASSQSASGSPARCAVQIGVIAAPDVPDSGALPGLLVVEHQHAAFAAGGDDLFLAERERGRVARRHRPAPRRRRAPGRSPDHDSDRVLAASAMISSMAHGQSGDAPRRWLSCAGVSAARSVSAVTHWLSASTSASPARRRASPRSLPIPRRVRLAVDHFVAAPMPEGHQRSSSASVPPLPAPPDGGAA